MNHITVILANGAFPTAAEPLNILHEAARVICCDGAAEPCLKAGRRPDAVIGDLDSIPPETKALLQDRIVHVTEQDTNDLNKAFRFCLRNGWTDLVILGGTGKREDHTLGNISLLADFALQAPRITMVTDKGTFIPLLHSTTLDSTPGQQISIFALEPDTHIQSTGLKYPLNGLAPSRWWQATLNEALSSAFTLTFPDRHPLLVFKVRKD